VSEPVIAQARVPEDTPDFINLMLMTAPEFFPALYGSRFDRVFSELFRRTRNHLSYQHVDVVRVDGATAGMVLGYDWAAYKKEGRRAGMVTCRYVGRRLFSHGKHLQWTADVLVKIEAGTHYISNMAVYPQFRRHGLGTAMLLRSEDMARKAGNARMALDVETCHEPAMHLYCHFGMNVVGGPKRTTIDGHEFEFVRMEKDIWR